MTGRNGIVEAPAPGAISAEAIQAAARAIQEAGPPEGPLTSDTLAAEYGVASAQLGQARRRIVALTEENEALRKANEQMARALETKQTPEGAPAGSAPRAARRAGARAAAKAKEPTPIASKRGAANGKPTS